MYKRISQAMVLFIGWVLSPFTWWNDAFVNMPISYIVANIIYYMTGIRFRLLVIGLYWATNLIGVILMYIGGKSIVANSRRKFRSIVIIIVSIAIFSAGMIYLDKVGRLLPIKAYFERFCVQHKTD